MSLIQTFPDGGGGSVEKVELTQAEYNTLTQEEKNNGTLYFITDAEGGGGSFDTSIIADDFDAEETYAIGDYCIYEGSLYKCTTAHTGAWNASHFTETQVVDEFGSNSGVQIPAIVGNKFNYNGTVQGPVITGLDSEHCTVTGTTSATNIGQYTITVTPSQGMTWTDGTSSAITFTYEIIPIGVKYTPTDDVQTWLACAEIWDKTSYTTLADVLADSETLETLLANGNAVDYLVRSTTWISSICSDEDAMTAIGASDVCADKLLADSTWRTAICDSTYFESVLNVKVPTMTSNTAPQGKVTFYPGERTGSFDGYMAFDGNTSTMWCTYNNNTVSNAYIQYEFPSALKCYKVIFSFMNQIASCSYKMQASKDGTNYTDVTDSYSSTSGGSYILKNVDTYKYYRLYITSQTTTQGATGRVNKLQFYGRASSSTQPVDMPYQASSLADLRDVFITNPKDGQIPQYDASIGKWVNVYNTVLLVPWSSGTDEQISAMIHGYYNDMLTLDDIKSVWSVGDVRNVDISAISASGGSGTATWSVGESHRAQTVQVQILDFDHDTLITPINGKTKALVTVDLKNVLVAEGVQYGESNSENGYMNTSNTNVGGWTDCARRKWCNYGFYNAIPSNLRNLIKDVKKLTSAGNNQSSIVESNDKVFFLSEVELIGSPNYSYAGEGTRYALYYTQANLIKLPRMDSVADRTSSKYWARSPQKNYTTSFCRAAGGIATTSLSYSLGGDTAARTDLGMAPAFCL